MPLIGTRGSAASRGFGRFGGGQGPWVDFATGQSYMGGVTIRYATKMAVRWYPESRITLGLTGLPSNKTAADLIPIGVNAVSIYGVGGGGGGTGSNGNGGGGGGAFSVTNVLVSPGTPFNVQAGLGGRGTILNGGISYAGDPADATRGQSGGTSEITISGVISLRATGGTGGTSASNPTDYGQCGQPGVGSILSNPFSYAVTTGTGGYGGSRSLSGTNGSNGAAGGGAGNNQGPDSTTNYDRGGNGSGRFGGGGGGGNAPGNYTQRTGGTGGSEAGAGGRGGSTDGPTFGLNGEFIPNQQSVSNAGGRAYIASDGTTMGAGGNWLRGSSGGGGFPGGGGGSSYYGGSGGDFGIASDGGSGMIQIEWNLA